MSLLTTIKNIFGFKSEKQILGPGDRSLACEDCRDKFVFDAGEQRFFKAKGFTDPKRCPRCRRKVRTFMRKKTRGPKNQRNHSSPRHSIVDGDSPYADER